MRIEVTVTDINHGKPNSPCACPVARAVKRATGAKYVEVREEGIDLVYGDGRMEVDYICPARVVAWYDRFDAGLPVEPFAFNLVEG